MTLIKQLLKKLKCALALFALLMVFNMQAQLSFPQGNVLNLNTTQDLLYMETRILFNTGIYSSDDYKWVKISDSIDTRWFVSACFNGQCQGLTDSGNFSNDLGINDSTVFIAFHVETYAYDGTSVIKYKVFNKNNASDQADLTFNVHYTNTAEIKGTFSKKTDLRIVNPASNVITVLGSDLDIRGVSLFDLHGKTICDWGAVVFVNDMVTLELPDGLDGFFILSLNINGTLVNKKVIIN